MSKLFSLHAEIDARVTSIREHHPDWQCAKGCDTCCRRLSEIPRLTAAEWDLLCEGLAPLPQALLQEISQKMSALAGQQARPVVCPLLDEQTGACPVYAQRPIACRSYGFYVQRNLGLYCQDIESRVAEGVLADVVWGNHDAIDQQLAGMGEVRDLTEWFSHWQPAR